MIPPRPIAPSMSGFRSPSGMTSTSSAPWGPPTPPMGPATSIAARIPLKTTAATTTAASSAGATSSPQQHAAGGPQHVARWVLKELKAELAKLGQFLNTALVDANALALKGQTIIEQDAAGIRNGTVHGLNAVGAALGSGHAGDQIAHAVSSVGETSEHVDSHGGSVSVAGAKVSVHW